MGGNYVQASDAAMRLQKAEIAAGGSGYLDFSIPCWILKVYATPIPPSSEALTITIKAPGGDIGVLGPPGAYIYREVKGRIAITATGTAGQRNAVFVEYALV
jgi:hypothetical protein